MGNANSCLRQLEEAFFFLMGALSMMEQTKSKIKRSKRHWSHVQDSNFAKEELAKASNMEVFEELRRHPKWGSFFYTFGEGELVVGKKFAEGAQGKVCEAQVKWRNPNWRILLLREDVLKYPDAEYVVKVFKKGTLLRDLQPQWPQGLFQFHAERVRTWNTRRYNCDVVCGTLLEDGRFAFLLQKEQADLRSLIERNVMMRRWRPWTIFNRLEHHGPFPKEVAEKMMYEVALGMDWLHRHNIVHRDLKASNVLVREDNDRIYCFVADYECSVGVFGTGFFRAPEILQACKHRNLRKKPELFSKEADVYSYGMTCYEILTGKLPFEGHFPYEYDIVLNGQRPVVPEYVDCWARDLLSRCWQSIPAARPSFGEILTLLLESSAAVRGNTSMDDDMAHSKAQWSQPKTEVFTRSQLVRMYRAKVYHTALATETEHATTSFLPLQLSDPSDMMNGSNDSDYMTALVTEFEDATIFSSPFLSARMEGMLESMESRCITDLIEHSKSHWSQLTEFDFDEEDVAEVSNVEVFKTLQMHPTWGTFFQTFGKDELVIGEKFAEGGQAELYEAKVTWKSAKGNEEDLKNGIEWVLKVFKKGTFLRHLQSMIPHGYLKFQAERTKLAAEAGTTPEWKKPMYTCDVRCGILLEDGRFAFLMQREQEDLRSLIDRNMTLRTGQDNGPFPKEDAEALMYEVALGMEWLHTYNIVHRDIKASNVLVREDIDGSYHCFICDYECSIGVIGTGFFRAPEILQVCKDKSISGKPELFTKAVDVYGYGMTCYEILTGKLPFEGHPVWDFGHVLDGHRPQLPGYVVDWTRELLSRCWQSNPMDRPSFEEILNVLQANSAEVRTIELKL